MSDFSDWDKLTEEQQKAVDEFRHRIGDYLTAQRVLFQQEHPEMRLSWSFQCDPYLGEPHYIPL